MTRTTPEEVRRLIVTNMDVSIPMETADLMITEDLADSGLTAARLKLIETYLAAHFVAILEERGDLVKHVKGESEEGYAGTDAKGLGMTRFGQQAIVLDTTGKLADLANPAKKAEFRVV